MRGRRDFAALAALAGAGASLLAAGMMQGATGPVSDPGFVSGTIRWVNSTTWVALDDAGHEPLGIESVTVFPSFVRVDYDFTADKVGSCQVTPDESFAQSDVRVGTSVGVDYLDVFYFMPSYGSTPVPPSLLSKAAANVWITCHHLVEGAP
jgi:hypothetical protein